MSKANKHHELATEYLRAGRPSNRSFGIVFAVVFSLATAHLAENGNNAWVASLAVTMAFLVAGLCNSRWLTPLNRIWMKFGALIGSIVAPLALGVLFYAVISPIGFIARRLGKDFLRIRRNSEVASYWIERAPPGPSPESMQRQF